MYYYRARYYDPEIGRFITEDPLGFNAGVNFYAYAGNNPINANDPSGLAPGDWWDPRNYDISRAKEIGEEVIEESQKLATEMTEDFIEQDALLWNGQLDAWRHAEWNRRMTGELNYPMAFYVGVGYEAMDWIKWAGNEIRDFAPGADMNLSFSQQYSEMWMDINNDSVGWNIGTPSPITVDDQWLVFGTGGPTGQPEFGFLDYVGTQSVSISSFLASGGFVLYPSRVNTSMVANVYSK